MIRHRLLTASLAGISTFLLCLAMLIQERFYFPGLLSSARAAVGDIFSSMIVALPVVGGIASADAIAMMKGKSSPVVESLPQRSRRWLLLTRVWLIWVGAMTGIALACAVTCFLVIAKGSPVTWATFSLVPSVAFSLAAYVCLGYAIGFWWRSWFAPPLLVVGGYVWGVMDYGAILAVFNSSSPPWSVYEHPSPVSYGVVLVLLAGLAGTSLMWLLFRPSLGWRVVNVVVSIVYIVGVCLADDLLDDSQIWIADERSAWSCQKLDGDSEVCVPQELHADLALVTEQLTPLAPRAVALDRRFASAVWVPGNATVGQLEYELPMGQDISVWEQSLAVASGLGQACYEKWSSDSEPPPTEIDVDFLVVSAWFAGDQADRETLHSFGIALPITLMTAKSAYSRFSKCTY